MHGHGLKILAAHYRGDAGAPRLPAEVVAYAGKQHLVLPGGANGTDLKLLA